MMSKKSDIDELFYRLMGHYPTKAGEAYEIVSAAALGFIQDQLAEHDKYLKGKSGGRPYQLDGLLNGDVMVESKDYTIDDRKVGRPDLQKLQGALSDLPQIKEGIFTSATEFSRDAIKYAKGTEVNDEQKTITTVDIRPSTPEDEEERVKTIVVQMQYMVPNFDRGEKSILFTDAGKKQIIDYMKAHGMTQYQLCVSMFYDENGEPLISMSDLSRQNQPSFDFSTDFVSGEFPIDAYIKFYDILVPIKGVSYRNVPIEKGQDEFTIEAHGNATLLIKSDKMGVNKLITDLDLKKAIDKIGGARG